MYIYIHKSKDKQYYFRIVAGNGQILAHSETYVQKESAKHAVQLIVDGAKDAEVSEVDD